jgi:hypothetical protein
MFAPYSCGHYTIKFGLFSRKILIHNCAFAPLGALRTDGVLTPKPPAAVRPLCFCFRPFHSAIFSGGYWERKKSEGLTAQIHHLIRKRFYHLNRKISMKVQWLEAAHFRFKN